jgi:hypothetical protein
MTFKYFTDLRFLAPPGQPPLTLPEIAQRLGVHPHYYENGITVSRLEQLPTAQDLFPKGYNQVDPNAVDWVRPFDKPGMPKADELPPQYDLEGGRNAIVEAWQNKGTILARVDPIQPPTWKEDENGIPRFETGQYAGQEVFIRGPGIPQWHVNTDGNRIVPVATVPPGGALQISSHDEIASQGEAGKDGESGSGPHYGESDASSHDGESGGSQEEPSLATEQAPSHEPGPAAEDTTSHEPSYTDQSASSSYQPGSTAEEATYHEPAHSEDSSSYQPSSTSDETSYRDAGYSYDPVSGSYQPSSTSEEDSSAHEESSLSSGEDSASSYTEDHSDSGGSDSGESDSEEPSYDTSYEDTSHESDPVEEDNSSFDEEDR